jgi:hypothetical protein
VNQNMISFCVEPHHFKILDAFPSPSSIMEAFQKKFKPWLYMSPKLHNLC